MLIKGCALELPHPNSVNIGILSITVLEGELPTFA